MNMNYERKGPESDFLSFRIIIIKKRNTSIKVHFYPYNNSIEK